MNGQQILNMVTRMVVQRVLRKGVDAGISRVVKATQTNAAPPVSDQRLSAVVETQPAHDGPSQGGAAMEPADVHSGQATSVSPSAEDKAAKRAARQARQERRAVREARQARRAARQNG